MNAETRVVARDFAGRSVNEPEAAAARAGFHAAMGRPAEARTLVAEAQKAQAPPAAGFEVDAMLLLRENKADEALAALRKAEQAGSTNFYIYVRLAQLGLRGTPDGEAMTAAERRLRKSVELNEMYAPSLSFLANVLAQQRQAQPAIEFATRAVKLEPQDTDARLSLARCGRPRGPPTR